MSNKYLALGHAVPGAPQSDIQKAIEEEIKVVWRGYLNGEIREVYQREDGNGVIMLLEEQDKKAAEEIVAQLPLAKAGLITVEVIGLTPFAMWSVLFADQAKA